MRILFVDEMGNNVLMETDILPRVGDKVDMFCRPFPVVKNVLLFPSKELLEEFEINEVDAIVTLN